MVIQYTKFQYRLINPTASAMGLFYFDSALAEGSSEDGFLAASSFAESESAEADSWDFFNEPKSAARA